jgi:hypothetical protein
MVFFRDPMGSPKMNKCGGPIVYTWPPWVRNAWSEGRPKVRGPQESTWTFTFRDDGGGARPTLESEEKAKPDRSRAIGTGPLDKPRTVNSPATRRSGLRRIAAEKSVIADYPRSTA